MTIKQEKNGSALKIAVSGRMDSNTAPELDALVSTGLDGVTDLTLDFDGLEYSSSAGLRVMLKAQKIMNRQGRMRLIHVCSDIRELLDVTGFSEFLTVE